jgi:hypothetical protein
MKNLRLLSLCLVLFVGCSSIRESSTHATREQAEQFLRKEGLIYKGLTIQKAEWDPKLNEWLFLVNYPSSEKTSTACWFVNSDATHYHGGICKH